MAEDLPSTHPLIASDRVEGTVVYDGHANPIGTIKRLMIAKLSGQVAYAVMVFGGFLGFGVETHVIPWPKLKYEKDLGGYRIDITADELSASPGLVTDDQGWLDSAQEEELQAHYRIPPHGRSI